MIGGPLGAPLTNTEQPDNIRYQCVRCHECRAWLLSIQASRSIRVGDALCGQPPPHVLALPTKPEPSFEVSFDGGARHRSQNSALSSDGPRAVGAGAALWGPIGENGRRPCIGQAVLSVPALGCSMKAEAIGLRAALALAAAALPPQDAINIIGDNLPILRMAAANGKVRTPGVWELLEAPLMHALLERWTCTWVAVRRHLNKLADQLATCGTCDAVDRAVMGSWTPSLTVWVRDGLNSNLSAFPWHPQWEINMSPDPLVDI